MAFIEVTEHETAIRALDGGILGQKQRDGSALRVIILLEMFRTSAPIICETFVRIFTRRSELYCSSI